MRISTHTILTSSVLTTAILLLGSANGLADEPTSATRLAQVRRAQALVTDLQPQLRMASTRLLAESLDRSRQIGEHAQWLSTTEFELQQIQSQLSERRHQPGADAFQDAAGLEQAKSELCQHREQLQAQHRTLAQEHVVRLAELQRPDRPTRSGTQRDALLSVLNSQRPLAPVSPAGQPIRVEVAKPIAPVLPPNAASDSSASQSPPIGMPPPIHREGSLPLCPPRGKHR